MELKPCCNFTKRRNYTHTIKNTITKNTTITITIKKTTTPNIFYCYKSPIKRSINANYITTYIVCKLCGIGVFQWKSNRKTN